MVPASSSVSGEVADAPKGQKGNCISKESLWGLISHVGVQIGFREDAVLEFSSGHGLRHFLKSSELSFSVHVYIAVVIIGEWSVPNRIALPRFMANLYPLSYLQSSFPDSFHIDSLVPSLVA